MILTSLFSEVFLYFATTEMGLINEAPLKMLLKQRSLYCSLSTRLRAWPVPLPTNLPSTPEPPDACLLR